MASGSWTFSTANKYITGRIRWTSTSNGNLYNSSNVTVYLDYKKSSKSNENTNGGYTGALYCGGQTYSFKLSSSKFYLKCDDKWVNMASHTFTVKHSRTGTCNVTLGLQGGHCTNGNSLSDPQTSTKKFTLDAITLYAPTFKTLTIDNVTQTSFRVNWAVNTYYNKVEYNINGGSYSLLSSSTGSSGSFTVSSRSPSTKYTIGVRVTRTDATSKVSTKTASATTVAIPQVNIPSLNFTLESEASNLNIEVTGLDKGSVKLTCSYTTDTGSTINLLDNVQIEQESAATIGGIGLDLRDDAILEQIYSNCKNTSKIPIKLTTTITGTNNNVYNNSYEGKMTVPTKYKPSFTGFTCTNVDTKTLEMLGGENNNAYIPQGFGRIQVEIPKANRAVGQKHANIANYKINLRTSNGTLIGSTVTKAYSSTASVIHDIGTTNTPGVYTVEVYATDSRGYDSSICTQEFIVLPYTKPEIGVQDLVLSRVNNFEKELILHLQGSYSSLLIGDTSYNSIIISYKGQNITNSVVAIDDASTIEGTLPITSKNQGDNTSFVYTFNDERFYKGDEQTGDNIISIDPSQIWKFVFTITDNLSSFPRDATIEQGSPIMAVVDNGMVGINMLPDVEDTSVKLQVNGDISATLEDGNPVKFSEMLSSTNPSSTGTFSHGGNMSVTGQAVVNSLEVTGKAHLANNTWIQGTTADGSLVKNIFQAQNSNNDTIIGYGNYDNSNGNTVIYGNSANIITKESIFITSPAAGLTNRQYGVNKVLWSGGMYMSAEHTVTLSEAISAQPHGIVIIFSAYNNGSQNWNLFSFFVPKEYVVQFGGCGMDFTQIRSAFGAASGKYLYINDTTIKGYSTNISSGTASIGITYNNATQVMRCVIGV